MKYLLSISIGPVQDFIATARRSRDLWFGSWLLSELSKSAAHVIVNEHKKEALIFPAVDDPSDLNEDSNFNVVNKIVALVDDPKTICGAIKEAMSNRLAGIRKTAFERISGPFSEGIAIEQVNDLTELYWAAAQLDDSDDPSQYKTARDNAEALLAARKSTRDFKQVLPARAGSVVSAMEWADHVPKSSLDGHRESVIHEDIYEAVRNGQKTKEDLRRAYGIREGERLCGVGLLKRHGNRKTSKNPHNDDSFFSTSHVAATPLLQRLTDASAVDDYIGELRSLGLEERDFNKVPVSEGTLKRAPFGRYDGRLLFEERLREFFDPKERVVELENARKALRRFLKQALNDERPKPYYALLQADGDRMGEAIDAQPSKETHQKLSRCLSEFAGGVRDIVENENGGSLVYSGGDDVLAFVPLHKALFCARALADDFCRTVKDFPTKEGRSPTLSVGIAVGHHLDPLQDTLELARQAEKAAKKQVKDKNALAIIVSKRSGPDWLVKGSWRDEPLNEDALDNRLNYFIYLHLIEALPRGFGYELRNVALRLANLKDAQSAECLRILRRKRVKDGKLKNEVFKKLERLVKNDELSIEDFAYQLIIARPFMEAVKQAGMDAKAFAARAGLKDLEA